MGDRSRIDAYAAEVHDAWVATMRERGVTSRRADDGEEQMAPWADLSERARDVDRATVRAVLHADLVYRTRARLAALAPAVPDVARLRDPLGDAPTDPPPPDPGDHFAAPWLTDWPVR